MTTTVFARIPFTYAGRALERGELVDLKGLPRDDQLLSLNYFSHFDPKEHSKKPCDNCGKIFATDGFYMSHKRKKGGCLAESPEITKDETAMLLNQDPRKVIVEE